MGQFITIDGPNGVGKSTTVNALSNHFETLGLDVLSVRQPSDSDLGVFARHNALTGLPLAAAIVSDRYLQLDSIIEPALARGQLVICDRYIASTLVLQRLDDLPLTLLWELNAQARVPDVSVQLRANPADIKDRLDKRGRDSRFERMANIETLESNYFDEAFELLRSKGFHTITANTSHSDVRNVVLMIVSQILS